MEALLQGIEAVLFDAVGTLIYPDPPAVEVYHRVGSAFGVELPLDEVGRRFRKGFVEAFADSRSAPTSHASEVAKWRQVVATVFRDAHAPLDAIFAELWEHFARSENWSLFPEVSEAWRVLEGRGYVLGVASNYDDRLPGVLAGMPPLDTCRHTFWSSCIGFSKPHPQFFRKVAKLLDLPPEKIVLVGDDWQSDVCGATEAEWKAVFLDRKNPAAAPPAIITLAELFALLG